MTKNILYAIGAVFIVIGLLGFVNNPILGIFQVDAVHNLIHLISGILALVFAGKNEAQARKFLLVLGIVYALVTILGFIQGAGKLLGIVSINAADNYLHLVLTLVFLGLGLSKASNKPSANM